MTEQQGVLGVVLEVDADPEHIARNVAPTDLCGPTFTSFIRLSHPVLARLAELAEANGYPELRSYLRDLLTACSLAGQVPTAKKQSKISIRDSSSNQSRESGGFWRRSRQGMA